MSKINQPLRFPRVLTSCEFINFVIIMVDGVKYM